MFILNCIFVSDLHGNPKRFRKLFEIIEHEKPDAVFMGGDLLPNSLSAESTIQEFLEKELFKKIKNIQKKFDKTIRFFIIMGNDDPRVFEQLFINADTNQLIDYVHFKTVEFNGFFITGYSYVPPTPFLLKDWERYDVSHFVDVGGIALEEGIRTFQVENDEIIFSTIFSDLEKLVKNAPPNKTVYLFHSPPYQSNLDRAALDNKTVDSVPLDVHIGSIAIQRFIQNHQPLLTLHGHVHETVHLTGEWKQKYTKTHSFTGVSYDSEFAVIFFDLNNLEKASRMVIKNL